MFFKSKMKTLLIGSHNIFKICVASITFVTEQLSLGDCKFWNVKAQVANHPWGMWQSSRRSWMVGHNHSIKKKIEITKQGQFLSCNFLRKNRCGQLSQDSKPGHIGLAVKRTEDTWHVWYKENQLPSTNTNKRQILIILYYIYFIALLSLLNTKLWKNHQK